MTTAAGPPPGAITAAAATAATALVAAALSAAVIAFGILTAPAVGADDPVGRTRVIAVGGGTAVDQGLATAAALLGGAEGVRIGGPDAASTAARVSAAFPTGGTVVVANDADFADGAAAGPLALAVGGPVLLVAPGTLPEVTRRALVALAPSRVLLVGGVRAISPAVSRAIDAAIGLRPERLAGEDRWATAAKVARAVADLPRTDPGRSRRAFLVSSTRWRDALPAAVAAASAGATILYADGDRLPAPTAAALRDLPLDEVIVVGDAESIAASVMAAVADDVPVVRRLLPGSAGGPVALDTFAAGAATVFLAPDDDFGTALAVAPLAALHGTAAGRPMFAAPTTDAATTDAASADAIGGPLLLVAPDGRIPDEVSEALRALDERARPTAIPTPTAPPTPPPTPVGAIDPVPAATPTQVGGPVAVDDLVTLSIYAAPVTLGVTWNDANPDQARLLVEEVVSVSGQVGDASVSADGKGITYALRPGACTPAGQPDVLRYRLSPGRSTAVVWITVPCPSAVPTAVDDFEPAVVGGPPVWLAVQRNDQHADQALWSVGVVGAPALGTAAIPAGGGGVIYTPPTTADCTGGPPVDRFSYTLYPGGSTATVHMSLTCPASMIPTPPTAPAVPAV